MTVYIVKWFTSNGEKMLVYKTKEFAENRKRIMEAYGHNKVTIVETVMCTLE